MNQGDIEERLAGAMDEGRALLPLTPAQRGMWFADRLSADYSVNTAQYLDLRHAPGGLDIDLLIECNYAVGRELETSYIRLVEVDGVPMQYVDVQYDQTVDLLDFRCAADPYAAALAWMQDEYRRTVDLVHDQLVVVAILRVAEDHTIWYQRAHHLIIDGFGALTTTRRILDRYNAMRRGAEPVSRAAATLAEIVDYETAYEASTRRRSDREYWLARAHGLADGLTLARTTAAAPLSFDNVVSSTTLRGDLQIRLREVARSVNSSIAVVLTAAFSAFLARMTDRDDVVLSLPVTGRTTARIRHSGGMLSNVLPVRLDDVAHRSVAELISAAQLELTGALRHQRYRSDEIRRDAGLLTASGGFGPVVNMVFFDAPIVIDGADVSYRILTSGALEDLLINLYQASPDAPLVVDLHGNPFRYDDAEIRTHHARFLLFLERFVADVDQLVGDIDLLLCDESDLLAPSGTADDPGTMPDVLPGVLRGGLALSDPARCALGGAATVTWKTFERASNRLARTLARRGAGPGVLVAVAARRSALSVLATVAIAKTGAAFVSVDPNLPPERRATMLRGAQVLLGVTTAGFDATDHADVSWVVVPEDIFDDDDEPAAADGAPIRCAELARPVEVDDIAYVIYTSGSTGTPKATAVTHRGLANVVANQQEVLHVDRSSRVLHVASPSFDASIFEILMAFGSGAQLVVADADTYAGERLAELIDACGVTHAVMTPSALETLDPEAVPTLRTVLSAGESCPPALAKRWARAGRRFFNLYGPTEATIWATAAGPLTVDDEITIGRGLRGVGTVVLDRHLRPVPAGVVGDLYLTGSQVALGYLERSALTAERFVAETGGEGGRMYRTGDRVSRRSDGRLDYRGRSDFQLKVRGLRIEPGEVDGVLTGHEAVASALSMGVDGPSGATALVSYVVPVAGAEPTADELRAFLAARLPSHLVPQTVTVIDEFPRTVVGKIDRAALPAVTFRDAAEYVAPRTADEKLVAGVFEQTLGIERAGAFENFFDAGGNSLIAATLAVTMSHATGREVTVRDVFENPTVESLARSLGHGESSVHAPLLRHRPHGAALPLSEVQRGMWVLNQADPDSASYNIAFALRITGPLDVPAVQAALGDLLTRQEGLRARFPIAGDPVAVTMEVAEVLAALTLEVQEVAGELGDAVAALTRRGFDLATGPVVRVAILRVARDEHVLVFVVHHIAADGASIQPLAEDFLLALHDRTAGRGPSRGPLAITYADFAVWQQELLAHEHADGRTERDRQLDYWRDRLAGVPGVLAIPTDRPRPEQPSFRGAEIPFDIPGALRVELERVARDHGTTLFAVLHAAFAVLLGRMSASSDVVIGTPYAGRGEPALRGIVGMFVNSVALRTRIDDRRSFTDLLDRVKSEILDDLAHADVAFESVVSAVGVPATRSRNPLFQAMLWFQNLDFPRVEVDGLVITPLPEDFVAAKVDLQLTVYPNDPAVLGERGDDPAMRAGLVYATDLFDEGTAASYAERFGLILAAVAADPGVVVGDIAILTTAERAAAAAEPRRTLSELVTAAALTAPEEIAISDGGAAIAFSTLSLTASAMAVALPDADSALTTAVMTLLPTVTTSGPERLGEVLGELRRRATAATTINNDDESVQHP